MTDYSNAKIYCIKSSQTEEVYYGSTCQALNDRFRNHRIDFKNNVNITSKQILQYEDAYIELVEEFPCNSKDELYIRERYYIENNLCVNKCIPGRTKKDSDKAYYEVNKEKIIERNKAHYQANKQKKKEYDKAYRKANLEANRERKNEYQRQYRTAAKISKY
jgi:hypothetical protein